MTEAICVVGAATIKDGEQYVAEHATLKGWTVLTPRTSVGRIRRRVIGSFVVTPALVRQMAGDEQARRFLRLLSMFVVVAQRQRGV